MIVMFYSEDFLSLGKTTSSQIAQHGKLTNRIIH